MTDEVSRRVISGICFLKFCVENKVKNEGRGITMNIIQSFTFVFNSSPVLVTFFPIRVLFLGENNFSGMKIGY